MAALGYLSVSCATQKEELCCFVQQQNCRKCDSNRICQRKHHPTRDPRVEIMVEAEVRNATVLLLVRVVATNPQTAIITRQLHPAPTINAAAISSSSSYRTTTTTTTQERTSPVA